MKRLAYIVLFFVISNVSSFATQDSLKVELDSLETEELAGVKIGSQDEAVAAYNDGDFRRAIALFEAEIKAEKAKGLESPEMYYNLGNAYFRVNELGKARVAYERAALLNPSDRDITHNINYLTTRIEDKILEANTFFLSIWFVKIQNILSTDTWAKIGVVLFILFIACLFGFFFTQQIVIKKIAFYTGIVLIVFTTFANVFAYNQKKRLTSRTTAIIMAPSVSVVSSPNLNSKELFTLHVGTKVEITKDDRSWLEIELDDGSVGWIQRDKLEII